MTSRGMKFANIAEKKYITRQHELLIFSATVPLFILALSQEGIFLFKCFHQNEKQMKKMYSISILQQYSIVDCSFTKAANDF